MWTDSNFLRTLCAKTLSYQELLIHHLPCFSMKRKRDIFEKALQVHKNTEGQLCVTRCTFEFGSIENNNLQFKNHDIQIKTEDGYFNYAADTSSPRRSVWYLNFADPNVFAFWNSTLFAQDEIQTLEHPLLCALRDYMEQHAGEDDDTFYPCTMTEYHRHAPSPVPTPILVENVPQWISVNTRPRLADGTMANIYGNHFKNAHQEAVDAGLKVVEDNIKTNILAIAAFGYSSGEYSKADIEYTLKAALAGFAQAAKIALNEQKDAAIHTGNWGCGAFGGNKEFMYIVQLIAASAVGISEIVFHGIDPEILKRAENKLKMFLELNDFTFGNTVNFLLRQKYFWGMSDGN